MAGETSRRDGATAHRREVVFGAMATVAAVTVIAVAAVTVIFGMWYMGTVRRHLPKESAVARKKSLPTNVPKIAPVSAAEHKERFEEALGVAVEEDFGASPQLYEACRDAVSGGKRIRAIIALEFGRVAANMRGVPISVMEAALAAEYVHCASLVIDDLPEFDNDSVRRGKPSLHAAHGRRAAMLAALSVVAAAMRNVGRQISTASLHATDKELAAASSAMFDVVGKSLGPQGAAGGQALDFETDPGAMSIEKLVDHKTASFFRLAALCGWIGALGSCKRSVLENVSAAAESIGAAFQIADDIGDMARDRERGAHVWNAANVHGEHAAREAVEAHLRRARNSLRILKATGPIWNEIFAIVRSMYTDSPDRPDRPDRSDLPNESGRLAIAAAPPR